MARSRTLTLRRADTRVVCHTELAAGVALDEAEGYIGLLNLDDELLEEVAEQLADEG